MITAPHKWRPSLVMVTAAMIGVVLAVAVTGFAVVRLNVTAPADVELVTALGLALLAALAVGFLFVRAISRPLSELAERAQQISAGEASAIGPLAHHGTRELTVLSESFMKMAASLSSRSAFVRTYSRHVSHELKTPITSSRGAAELLLDNESMPPEQRRRFLKNILDDLERMTELLERLNQQALAETSVPGGAVHPREVLGKLRDRFPGLEIVLSGADAISVAIAPESLLMALQHLAANAGQHGAHHLRIDATADASEALLIVEDDGSGISAGNRERVFDPFFTTHRGDGGTGMGLTIARSMLEAHRGTIRLVESERGARFEVRLPLADTALHKIS